ncbi:hypothetical protein I6F09_24105 [Bradyrhizobium sp. IC3195]|uniref:hypothetical protein n=1 Tax=Bradyrhizobium sp. IC3195 TaxID=2793804 RepID=UPI001CD1EE16|nr:hypothetical protein [Bradyrhizobium sp. IC3195]MCA1470968.1 hypothetical protein [Bradyrhizobium sp. IC3195]
MRKLPAGYDDLRERWQEDLIDQSKPGSCLSEEQQRDQKQGALPESSQPAAQETGPVQERRLPLSFDGERPAQSVCKLQQRLRFQLDMSDVLHFTLHALRPPVNCPLEPLPFTPRSWSEGLKTYRQPKHKLQFDALPPFRRLAHQEGDRNPRHVTDTDHFASRFKLVIDRSSEMTRGYILSFENAEAKRGCRAICGNLRLPSLRSGCEL